MAEKARDQMDKTSNEFSNVANSRKVPDQTAATGQPLTQYHSLFYNILSVSLCLDERHVSRF